MDELIWKFSLTSYRKRFYDVTLFPNNCTSQCIFFLIAELKSKLLNALHMFKIWKTLFLYFSCKLPYIFLVIFSQLKFIIILQTKTNEKLKLRTLFLLYSIVIKHFFLALFRKTRCRLIPILRFCYFLENILSLKSYYQLSYVSVWLTGILLTIANILINSRNAHFHLTLEWSDAASIKLCRLNESVVVIITTSRA